MDFSDFLLLLLIIVLILISGFLSGSETAITAVSKPRIISKIKQGSKRALYVKKIIDLKESVISSLLLSNNLVNILASALATAFFYDIFGISGIFYATLLMTFLLVIFAEVLPKTYAINKPTHTVILISPIIFYLNKILYPLVVLINLIVKSLIEKIIKTSEKVKDEQLEEEKKKRPYISRNDYLKSLPKDEHGYPIVDKSPGGMFSKLAGIWSWEQDFLDDAMQYSSALFLTDSDSLHTAQKNKMKRWHHTLEKLKDESILPVNMHRIIMVGCRGHSFLDCGQQQKSTKEINFLFSFISRAFCLWI